MSILVAKDEVTHSPKPKANVFHLTAQILQWKLSLQREENLSTHRKILGVRLRSTNLSLRAEPGNRSRVVEVEVRLMTTTPTWLPK